MDQHSCAPVVTVTQTRAWRSAFRGRLVGDGFTPETARNIARKVENRLSSLHELLDRQYGSPHLGNWRDPTDEFVFIVLSRKTREAAYTLAFSRLKALGQWDQVAEAREDAIATHVESSGLARKKARALKLGLATIRERFGSCDLSRAHTLTDDDLFSFLSSLPEMGPKSARCVMLYSFGRATFPVDAHVGRVLARTGVLEDFGLNLLAMNHKRRQATLSDLAPPRLRFGLHVNLIMHGRLVCLATNPRCGECSLRSRCAHRQNDLRVPRNTRR